MSHPRYDRAVTDPDWPQPDPPQTDQEEIAFLRGNPVPDRPGYTFGEIERDGDIFDVEIIRDSDGAPLETARGTRADEIVKQAQEIADGDPGT